MLPYGYRSYTGKVWLDCHVDTYNAYCQRCDALEKMKGRLPDYMANGRHNLFQMFSNPVPILK
jgi:hypothetical protein